MNKVKYSIISDEDHFVYNFFSEGPKGAVRKVIHFTEFSRGIYNLAFGDWDEARQKIDDLARTNNNDRDKVLVTVASAVLDFLKHHPRALIIAKGSTGARTRLYQIGIVANWLEISTMLEIKGYINESWQHFEPIRITRLSSSEPKKLHTFNHSKWR